MDELIERLGFWVDRSGATAVLREVGGGCHPATRSELALWDALEAAREDAERYRWLKKSAFCNVWARGDGIALVVPRTPAASIDSRIDAEMAMENSND